MVAAAALVVFQLNERDRVRIDWAQAQLEAWAELAAHANRYSEQIAEVLLLGEEELPDFRNARAAVDKGLDALAFATQSEAATERTPDTGDSERLARVRTLYREVDRTVDRILRLRAAGRLPEAVALLREEVENRFDAELDSLIAEGMEDERGEVAEAERNAAGQRRLLSYAMVGVVAAALGGTVMAGRRLHRSLVPPIRALAEGAEALGEGELSRRVAVPEAVGELAVLAARFNAMAERIADQHRRLLLNRADLEAEVLRRTEELEVANRQLQEVDSVRVRFLADLSHELRTPLTVLRGEAELALRGGTGSGRHEAALSVIIRQAMQMDRLVADLLYLARSETEEARLETQSVVLQDLTMEAMEDGMLLARAPAGAVIDDWPEKPIVVRADPARLKQALMILIDNALKYAPPGRPAQVALRRSKDGAWGEIAVTNEGPGLLPGEMSQAFERFFRGRRARAGDNPGSGLGLPIAKRIIERHCGTLELDSAAAGPTVLRICLPLKQGQRNHAPLIGGAGADA